MASVFPLPDFERGQALLARDFAALVGAVRELVGGGDVVQERRSCGRRRRPFVLAGGCVPRLGAAGVPVAGVAEVLFQVGENVTLCEDGSVGGMAEALAEAEERGVPCGVHGWVDWVTIGDAEGFSLRAVGMECEAAAWVEPVFEDDGSVSGSEHGDVVFSVVWTGENERGQVQRVQRPWVLPQGPVLVYGNPAWGMEMMPLLGDLVVLPGGADGWQPVSRKEGGVYVEVGSFERVFHVFFARLDRHGLLHFCAFNV